MQAEKNSLSKWIVKSENRILGPYSYEQIEDLIRKKQISLIDEVRDSATRWLYVRENPEFKDIVESIRKELDSKLESTKTFQSFSKTEEMSKTKTDLSSLPEGPTSATPNVQDISVVKEIIQNQVSDKKPTLQTESSGPREKVKLYGLEKDAAVQKQVSSTGLRFLIGLLVVLVLALAAAGGFFYYQKMNEQKQEDLWTQQIKKYKFLGLDQKAAEIFGRLPAELQKKTLPDVIELLPLLEGNGVVRAADVDALKSSDSLMPEQRANLLLVQFWMAVQSQNFDLAEDLVTKASRAYPASRLVKENDAIIQYKKGHFKESLTLYQGLYKNESSGRFLYGMVLALIGLPEAERSTYVAEVSQLIEKYTFIYYDYKKELLLAQMVFAKWEKNESLFQKSWKQFLNTPCQLSSLFKKPLLLAPNSYLWKDVGDYVKDLKTFLDSEETVLFETHRMIESSQISAASEYLTQNAAKVKDPLVRQQLNMLIFHFQSRISDVVALDKTNQLDMKSELNHVVLALDKLEESPNADISKHFQFFNANQMNFYQDWITLVQLMKQGAPEPLKAFTRNHFLTVNNFLPALEAKSLVE